VLRQGYEIRIYNLFGDKFTGISPGSFLRREIAEANCVDPVPLGVPSPKRVFQNTL
jgi:hypothetical protein